MSTTLKSFEFESHCWNQSLTDVGVQIIDRTLSSNASWEEILQSGREEWSESQAVCCLKTGPHLRLLDVGCGIGRVSYALADHYGEVVGVDISRSLLQLAIDHNNRSNLRFELMTMQRLQPGHAAIYDTIFSDEVFHYVDWKLFSQYAADAFRLLRNGGEYAFQLNLEPISIRTKFSWIVRSLLYWAGIKTWRNWSTNPGLIRHYHHPSKVRALLKSVGFTSIRIGTGDSVRQTWFVAQK